ncbi:hypothetical protein GDO78_001674 [Eleutherodactylus coqui]|uniref:Uncharacterized protein n=1 Tax=Eleutherodactylus coqui TaxID=57060 RepID=A0A8J6FVW2_ELECQ|nr:hypothetical protein GDO78_001674 [Eleutherodactylus coqui]
MDIMLTEHYYSTNLEKLIHFNLISESTIFYVLNCVLGIILKVSSPYWTTQSTYVNNFSPFSFKPEIFRTEITNRNVISSKYNTECAADSSK